MNNEKALREQLVRLLDWDSAHARFDDAVKDFPVELRGTRPEGSPHSPWELLEHLRIALWDILEFSRDAKHESPEFPSGYWPAAQAPPADAAWEESAEAYRRDLRALEELAGDEAVDLYAPIPHGKGQTILREIFVAADHNAYHVGQLMIVRRILGA
jgi:DinB superfamily